MFLQASEACSMPNSETPMSQDAIDRQNAFIANVGTAFDDGDDALNSLLQILGGNPGGDTSSGAAGVPTTGTLDTYIAGIPVVPTSPNAPPYAMFPTIGDPLSWAWAPSPAAPVIVPGGGAGWRAPQGESWNGNRRRYHNQKFSTPPPTMNIPANCPVVIPLTSAIPIPPQMGGPVTGPTAPAPPPPPPPPPVDCRTGNICLDIRRGCVLSSQVSPQQLQACSQAGYAGNENLFAMIAAHGGAMNGEFFGTPDPNPAPFVPGMGGLGQDPAAQAANASIVSNAFEYVIAGLVTVAAMAILSKSRKK
jgi:hypothetical protein